MAFLNAKQVELILFQELLAFVPSVILWANWQYILTVNLFCLNRLLNLSNCQYIFFKLSFILLKLYFCSNYQFMVNKLTFLTSVKLDYSNFHYILFEPTCIAFKLIYF